MGADGELGSFDFEEIREVDQDRIYAKYLRLRDKLEMTDSSVAKKAGISKSTFSDWRSGRSKPKMQKLEKIANAMGVSVSYFSEDAEVPNSGHHPEYYIDRTTAEIAQELFTNPDMRVLFDAARDSRPEDLQRAADLLRRFKETNPNG